MLCMVKQSKTWEIFGRTRKKQKKDYLKQTSKPIYIATKSLSIYDNDLVAIRKRRVTLKLNKVVY